MYWDAAQRKSVIDEGLGGGSAGRSLRVLQQHTVHDWMGHLEIHAGHRGNTQEDEITFFLAGYLEGYLTTR